MPPGRFGQFDFLSAGKYRVLARMPLVKHGSAVFDPFDLHAGKACPIHDIAIHRPPPCEIFVISADIEEKRPLGGLNTA